MCACGVCVYLCVCTCVQCACGMPCACTCGLCVDSTHSLRTMVMGRVLPSTPDTLGRPMGKVGVSGGGTGARRR